MNIKKIFFGLSIFFLFLFTISSALAVEVPEGGVSYWNFSDTTDLWGSKDATNNGSTSVTDYPTFNIAGNSSPNSFSFDGSNDFVYTQLNPEQTFTISLWFKFNGDNGNYKRIIGWENPETTRWILLHTLDGNGLRFRVANGIHGDYMTIDSNQDYNDGNWHHAAMEYANGTGELYIDNSNIGTDTHSYDNAGTFINMTFGADGYIGKEDRQFFNGYIDEIKVYNDLKNDTEIENLYNYGNIAGIPQSTSNKLETTSTIRQTNLEIITDDQYNTIVSGQINNTNSTPAYASAIVNMYTTNFDDINCKIEVNNNSYNSEITTTSPANRYTNVYLQTKNFTMPEGINNVTVQCQNPSNNTFYINSTNVIVHYATTSNDELINYTTLDVNTTISNTTDFQKVLETSFNVTEEVLLNNISLIFDGNINYEFNSEGNISAYLNISGETTPIYKGYGLENMSGSTAGFYIVKDVPANSTKNISLYMKGDGNITGQFFVKEFITPINSLDVQNISKNLTTQNWEVVESITINNPETISNLVAKASIPTETNVSIEEMEYKLEVADTNTSSIIQTVFNKRRRIGVIHNVFKNLGSGNKTVTLYAKSNSTDVTVLDGNMIAYFSDNQEISPLYFNTTAYDSYNNTQIIDFTVERNGAIYSSNESGVAKVFYNPDGDLRNVTIRADNYLDNFTEHNINNDLNATLDYYLARVNFTATDERNSVSLNNFTIQTPVSTLNTTSGNLISYLNRNVMNNITFTSDGYATKKFQLNGTDLHTYDISVERSNSIDISIYDYPTNSLIDSQEVNLTITTIRYSQENTTSTGEMFLTELPTGDYTLELESSGYEKSTYYFSVTAASYQELKTYMRATDSCSDVVFSVIQEDTDPIQDVYLSFQKFINSSWNTILQKKTDFAGQAVACLDNELYRIVATHDNYQTKQFELTPIRTEYTLSMESIGDILYQNSWLTDITYYTEPKNTNNLTSPAILTFGVSSTIDNIDSFSMQTIYNDTIYSQTDTSSVGGGEISITIPIDNSTSTYLEVNYSITNINGQTFEFQKYYTSYSYAENPWNIETIFEDFEGEDPLLILLFFSTLILLISGILYYVGFKTMQILIADSLMIGFGMIYGFITLWIGSIILFFIISTLAITIRWRY